MNFFHTSLKSLKHFLWLILIIFCFSSDLVTAQEPQESTNFLYGEKLYKDGLYELAAIQFQNFISDYANSPRVADAQFRAAECFFLIGKFQDAQKAYLRVILNYPDSRFVEESMFKIGACYQGLGKLNMAAEAFIRVNSFYPKSHWATEGVIRSAQIFIQMDILKKAESTLNLLLNKVPSGEYRSKGILLLARVYIENEEYEKAISLLNGLRTHPLQADDKSKALLMLGEVYENMGRWQDSKGLYKQLLKIQGIEDVKQKAWFRMGLILSMEGTLEDAVRAFQQSVELGEDHAMKTVAYLKMGDIKTRMENFHAALEDYKAAEKFALHPENKMAAVLKEARSLESMGKPEEAELLYTTVLSDSSASSVIVKKALLFSAQLLDKAQNDEMAVARYNRYLRMYPGDELAGAVLLRKGCILLQDLGLWDEAFSTFRRIWHDYPSSVVVPEARFCYAGGLELVGRLEEVYRIYKNLILKYPGTPWAEKAVDKVKHIETFDLVDYTDGFSELTSLVQMSISGQTDWERFYKLGMISFRRFKQYNEAIGFFKQYIESQPGSAKKDSVLFYMGMAYEILYSQNSDINLLKNARKMYNSVLTECTGSLLCDNADLIKAVLDSEKSFDMRAKSFSDLLEKYPDSDKKDEIIFRLGNELDQLNSLDRARTVLQRLVIDFPQSPFYEEALVRLGKINIRIGDYKTADSLFTTYWINFKDGKFQPEVQFIHADLLKQFGDFDGAASRFKTILKRYSFSIWADSARIHLGALYLDTGSYDKAFNLYRTALKNDSLQTWSFVAGLQEKKRSFRKVYLLGLAQACQGLNLYKKAKMYYYLYYSEYSLLNEKIRVYLALAKIAEKEGLPDRAVDYLKKVVQEMPVDSTLEAMGELYFTLGRYQEAAETFDHPITSTLPVGKQALFAARVIVSLLRQDKIPQADVRIDVYSQAYKSNPMGKDYMAEFMFERGLAYFRKKEFTAAKESFEEVLRKYKKSRFCPMAEFEIGRVYLITNKIEDALKILTDMPRRYPDNLPVLAKIYLNLGEHYYRSKQFDNALNALIMAKEYGNDSDILPVALRKLIGLYDEMGMYDAAMAITRKYIHDYPEADDILEKEVKIGNLYMKLNDFTRAVEHFRTIKKEADPDTEAEIQYWIGKSYYRMGQFEQAIFEFLKVKYLSQPTKLPWATTAMYESGISYIKLEKYQQARMLFEKIVRREGATSVLGRIARQRIQEIDDASVAVN